MPGTLKRRKPFVLAAAVLLAISAAAWPVAGPTFLTRAVELTINAKKAGQRWSLEWQDKDGRTISGAWIEAAPDEQGQLHLAVNQAIPNYAFPRLALRWWGAPDLELMDPGLPRLSERVWG